PRSRPVCTARVAGCGPNWPRLLPSSPSIPRNTTMIDHDSDSLEPLAKLIDRMVDGGLTPAQLRRAVRELDSTPGGWRRCALSFLEVQTWGGAFRNLDRTVEEKPRLLPGSECSEPLLDSVLPPVSTKGVLPRRWI